MMNWRTALFSVILAVQCSCSTDQTKQKELELMPQYQKIQTIIAIADCNGPNGNYVTEVRSSIRGSTYFHQKKNDEQNPFIASVDTAGKGYIIDEKSVILDTLSPQHVEMIRGHEIHKMISRPDLFFKNIHYVKDTIYMSEDHELHKGLDNLEHPVNLFYNRMTHFISKIELLKSLDTSQVIEIINSDWIASEYGQMPQKAVIVQAKKDSFRFNFHTLKINE